MAKEPLVAKGPLVHVTSKYAFLTLPPHNTICAVLRRRQNYIPITTGNASIHHTTSKSLNQLNTKSH